MSLLRRDIAFDGKPDSVLRIFACYVTIELIMFHCLNGMAGILRNRIPATLTSLDELAATTRRGASTRSSSTLCNKGATALLLASCL